MTIISNSIELPWSSASNLLYTLNAGSNLIGELALIVSNVVAIPEGPRFYDVGVE